jgi:hypothetical protein
MIGEEREKEDCRVKDIQTKIITYLSGQIMKRIRLKTFLDTREMLYCDEEIEVFVLAASI